MARINIVSVNFIDNPNAFKQPYKLDITFEAFEHLEKDIEWQLIYVGSGTSNEYDQVLDSVFIGPTPEGRHQFVFETDAPDIAKIPKDDLLGVAGLLLKAKYDGQVFICLGWYVQIRYTEAEWNENPPADPVESKLTRKVMVDDVRVTNYPIKWNDLAVEEPILEDMVGEEDIAFDLAEPSDEQKNEDLDDAMESSDSDGDDSNDEEETDLNSDDTDDDDEEDEEVDDNKSDGDHAMTKKVVEGDQEMEVENAPETGEIGKEKSNNCPTEDALNDVTNA